jgi:hypothetical protein
VPGGIHGGLRSEMLDHSVVPVLATLMAKQGHGVAIRPFLPRHTMTCGVKNLTRRVPGVGDLNLLSAS